eukprot:TRINITY_DN55_c1_g1_i1.p1 TRINITY_DN55_c1_g1~~TRINITY_DN55_c1_g1_i1.p1  ORF type:complete len:693 (-),score=234.92 TRINITY_DN55_c1_g1_i1:66-2144(-)
MEKKDEFKALVDIEEENGELKLLQGLDQPLQMTDVLQAGNAVSLDDIINIVNHGQSSRASSSIFGTLIDPGKVGIIEYNGQIQAIGPGRWLFPNPRAELKEVKALTDNLIQYESLSIVRVQRGEVGLANEGGPILLAEGIHVRNSRLFQFIKCEKINQPYIKHGSIHIVRVPKGSFGLVLEAGVPKMLPEGIHVANSNVFSFASLQPINQPYLNHGALHLLRIPKGQVALVINNNRPKLLGEGTHFINSTTFNYFGMKDLNQEVIKHGTITRFRVRKGQIGLAWDNNQPTFFEEGIYEIDSPNFNFEKCADAGEKQISLGSRKIITVWDGEVGISFRKGKLQVLLPDRHVIESVDHIFQGFMSTQQQSLALMHDDQKNNSSKEARLLFCETKDFVEIGIRSDVFYKIIDAERVLLVVGKDNIVGLVRETSIATLNSIIRSTSLAEVAQNKEVAARSEKQHLDEVQSEFAPSAPLFFDKVHDEFIAKLHDSFMEKYGIEITNIRIESFKITDAELSANISKQALSTAQTENQLANLEGQTEIATAQQRRDAEVNRIRTEAESFRLKTSTDAANKATMETAKAEADAAVIRARAEAQAIQLRAEADAKCILLKADAEAKRAELLSVSPLGGQLAMFQLYSEMVKKSMSGVEKTIYLPTEAINNPFPLFSAQGSGNPFFSGMTEAANAKKPGRTN